MNKLLTSGDKKISVSQINLPKGGDGIRTIGETFQVNKFTGTANLNIPIPVSACRDFEPHLSLEYSSGAGNGIFGIGFNLSLPSISRNTARAIPEYDDTDLFLLSRADDLVPVRNSLRDENINSVSYSVLTYRPRTEEFFDRIEKWTNLSDNSVHWRVTNKDNATSVYGESERSQIADPADITHVFQWLIERTYDSRGNQIVYEYEAEQGNKYIQKIKYGNYRPDTEPNSDDWHFEIGFEYSKPPATDEPASTVETGTDQPCPDPFSSYKSGFQLFTSLRCIRISMSHRFESESGPQLFEVNATEFDYRDSVASSNLSLLKTVTHIGYGNNVVKKLPPLEFTWSKFQVDLDSDDFTGGIEPYLLTIVDNNMGATTHIHYCPSTKFYLADEKAGTSWVTRLPFPVQVVEKLETIDHINDTRLVKSYTYHHGYYDPIDCEFRGFGRVEEQDAETSGEISGATDESVFHMPPVTIKTWYHTGAFTEAGLLSQQYAAEYYQGDSHAHHLADSTLDPQFQNDSPESTREAYRALHGHTLREEIFGISKDPYLATEWNYYVRLDQPNAEFPYAVCFVQPRERVSYHYECNPKDPRIGHSMVLDVDPYGNVCKSLDVAYGRRTPVIDPDLTDKDKARQSQLLITYTENTLTNAVLTGAYYLPLAAQTRIFELTGFEPEDGAEGFGFSNGFTFPTSAVEIPYEQLADHSTKQKRLIKQFRTLYRPDDMGASQGDDPLTLLPLGQLESLALPGESYELAFTPGLLNKIYQRPKADKSFENLLPNPASILEIDTANGLSADRGGYLSSQTLRSRGTFPLNDGDSNWTSADEDDHWWVPSSRIFLSPNTADKASDEHAYAKEHFYLPHRTRDPFHTDFLSTESFITYDAYDLLVQETSDALGNRITAINDYRVLNPRLVTDPNGNRTAIAFDALGMVVATAVMGKDSENVGDLLEGFSSDPSAATLQAFIDNPQDEAAALLGKTTAVFIYDLDCYRRTCRDHSLGQPSLAATVARETHVSDLMSGQASRIQISFVYSDGFGREIQTKVQAKEGESPRRGADVLLPSGDIQPGDLWRDSAGNIIQTDAAQRWVGVGRTVYNNKGQPVKHYEPFFGSTHLYEPESDMTDVGVSSILFYDSVGRVVSDLHPNHTYEKVVFSPWRAETWDANDTILMNPKDDLDVRDFFNLLPLNKYQPTWYEQRKDGQLGADEKSAADKAASHAETPGVQYFDALNRPILTIADNGKDGNNDEQKFYTRVILDVEGNQLQLIDAKERIAMQYDYDMLGNRIHQAIMDAGECWMLYDVMGEPIRGWDCRGIIRTMTYDALRRPTELCVTENGSTRLAEKTLYGEAQGETANHRARVYQVYDGAGVVTNESYDFKGNLVQSQRELLADYQNAVDWAQNPQHNDETFTSKSEYDALNRPISVTMPDGSVYYPTFNKANLLDTVQVSLRGDATRSSYVTNIDYNAKGQRELIEYGNGAGTMYEYDEATFRLIHLKTTRPSGLNDLSSQLFVNPTIVQDQSYTYDPVGNITHIMDQALPTIQYNNQNAEPTTDYTYDATYRLVSAQGREHIGQTAFDFNPLNGSYRDYPFAGVQAYPNIPNALRSYIETYEYDEADNFYEVRHTAAAGSWTRTSIYHESSLLEAGKQNNRLTSTIVGNGAKTTETYSYTDTNGDDAQGLMTSISTAGSNPMRMAWDFKDQLQSVDLGGSGTAKYVYDASGQRVRIVIERQNGAKQERIYLGGFEIYREFNSFDLGGPVLERQTIHVTDDGQPVALIETKTIGISEPGTPLLETVIRYQVDNHLGSTSLELDDQSQIISYEEYSPYGSTSYQAVRSQIETPKRYRYSGKERDDATGFYYYGARYYLPWLGRWTNPDLSSIKGFGFKFTPKK